MFEITLWVLFGALVGWVVSLMVRTVNGMTVVSCIVGVIGAVAGGALFRIYGHPSIELQVSSILSAVGGSIFVLGVVEFVRQEKVN